MEATSLKIACPGEPDMEGTWKKEDIDQEILEVTGEPPKSSNYWIDWVMFHCDVDDYFSDEIINVVMMPEFRHGTFVINGVRFTFEKK